MNAFSYTIGVLQFLFMENFLEKIENWNENLTNSYLQSHGTLAEVFSDHGYGTVLQWYHLLDDHL